MLQARRDTYVAPFDYAWIRLELENPILYLVDGTLKLGQPRGSN